MTLMEGPFAMIAPLLVWGAHLLFVYVVLAIGCAARPQGLGAIMATLWVATAVALVVLALLTGMQYRAWRQGLQAATETLGVRLLARRTAPLISLISLVAVLWTALPLLFIAPCE